MPSFLRRASIFLVFVLAALGPFLLYFTSGLSFYTFHAISGLLPLKHISARCFLQGEYPLWNPFMLCGVPFHSGIGILDPLLITYFFFKGITALLASAYLALLIAGLSMYAYLRKSYDLSIPAALLGGILYLANPFFAATCHEIEFMAPPIYLPLIFLFYDHSVKSKSLAAALLAGLCLSFSFLSGNLESFYFVLLSFSLVQILRGTIVSLSQKSIHPLGDEFIGFVITVTSAFLFSAVDLIPTIAMIFNSQRNANSTIVQNMIHFALVGGGALLTGFVGLRVGDRLKGNRGKWQWLLAAAVFILFAFNIEWRHHYFNFNRNLFYPNIKMLMLNGSESFQILMKAAGISKQTLLPFMEPRFIFYIQPPLYLFTLSTLFIFSGVLAYTRRPELKAFGFAAVLLLLFPYTSVPNLNNYLLKLDVIAYPRISFIFFFIQSLLVAYGFDRLMANRINCSSKPVIKYGAILGVFFAVSGMLCLIVLSRYPFEPVKFKELLQTFGQHLGKENLFKLSCLHGRLVRFTLQLFLHDHLWILLASLAKYAAFLFLCLAILSARAVWKYLFILFISLDVLAGWSLYTFQKKDVQFLTHPYKETQFLKTLSANDRTGTIHDAAITDRNFYDEERGFQLRWNMPLFWDVKTAEGATLNLSPKLFSEFWALEPRNSYTPTTLEAVPSKLYDLMGLDYLFSSSNIKHPAFHQVLEGSRYKIYQNLNALPRFYFAKQMHTFESQTIKNFISQGKWDPLAATLIESAIPEKWKPLGKTEPIETPIEIIHDGFNELTFKTQSRKMEFLATTEAFHKGWKVFVDGTPASVIKTNSYFRGVFIDRGIHEVRFLYRPWEFVVGAVVSCLSVLGLLLVLWVERRPRIYENA